MAIIKYSNSGEWNTLLDISNITGRLDRLESLAETFTANDTDMLNSIVSHSNQITALQSTVSSMQTSSYYRPGDSFGMAHINTAGFVTSAGKSFRWFIPTPKPLYPGTGGAVSGNIVIRQNGTYLIGGASATVAFSSSWCYSETNGVTVAYELSSAPSGVTNNSNVGIECSSVVVTFV